MELIAAFKVPQVAVPVIDAVLNGEERALIEGLVCETFSIDDAERAWDRGPDGALGSAGVRARLASAYARGVIHLEDESFTRFRVASLYDRLEVFTVTQSGEYAALSAETRAALDDWYFHAYCERLGDELVPTDDAVVSLKRALDYIDTIDRPIWLNRCDCRTLAGACESPVETCISFRNGINTMSHRGWSKPLTKPAAKEIVRKAHRAGLMQTINSNGICNCCSDCCYLFRAQRERGSGNAWPKADLIAEFTSEKCIACGACVRRCPFGAFEIVDGAVTHRPERCRGCTLCAPTCPVGAITMRAGDDAATRD